MKYCITLLVGVLALVISGCSHTEGPFGPDGSFDAEYEFEYQGWARVNDREIDVSGMPQEFDLMFKSKGIRELMYSAGDHNCSAKIIDELTDIDNIEKEYRYFDNGECIVSLFQRVHVDMQQEKTMVLILGANLNYKYTLPCRVTLTRK